MSHEPTLLGWLLGGTQSGGRVTLLKSLDRSVQHALWTTPSGRKLLRRGGGKGDAWRRGLFRGPLSVSRTRSEGVGSHPPLEPLAQGRLGLSSLGLQSRAHLRSMILGPRALPADGTSTRPCPCFLMSDLARSHFQFSFDEIQISRLVTATSADEIMCSTRRSHRIPYSMQQHSS